MLQIGVTGGIGAGKSEVVRLLAEWGAYVIEADRLAADALLPGTDVLAAVVDEFGPGILTADGTLNRPALAELVFGDERARRRLEKIVHPRVRARTQEIVAGLPASAVVVHEVPLIAEAGLADRYDLVIVVEADLDVRLRRLVEQRGMAEADVRRRMSTQATDADRRTIADVVIRNNGDRKALANQVDEFWRAQVDPLTRS